MELEGEFNPLAIITMLLLLSYLIKQLIKQLIPQPFSRKYENTIQHPSTEIPLDLTVSISRYLRKRIKTGHVSRDISQV